MSGADLGSDAFHEALGSGMTLAYWAAHQPDSTAIVAPGGGRRSFAEMNADANRLVRALRRRGHRPGDAVAAVLPNSPEFVIVLAAVQRAGFRLTPVNWHLTAGEVAYIVDDCEASVLVGDVRFSEAVVHAARRSPRLTTRLATGGEIDDFDRFDLVLAEEDGADIDDPTLGSTMLYTSGTTGQPKGVHRPSAGRQGAAALSPFGYRPGESVHLCTGPLYHTAPLAFSLASPLAAGASVVLMDDWSAPETLRLIEQFGVTHTHMVPTMFQRLLSLPDHERLDPDVSSLRLVVHGAAPCPVETKRRMIEWWGPVLLEYYAATEGIGTFVTSQEWLQRPGTVGKPSTDDHIRILDDDGRELPAGAIGNVYLEAPAERFQYFNAPDKTASAYVGDYFNLGDVGYLDDDNYLFLTGRSAEIVISGGINIYPAEIEAVLLQHPGISDAAVVGLPDPDWGESVLAVVEPRADVQPSDELADRIVEHCRSQLAGYKCPRRVEFVERLPRSDNGKLLKRRLIEERSPTAPLTAQHLKGNPT